MSRVAIIFLGMSGFVAASKPAATHADSGKQSNPDVKSFVPNFRQYIPDYNRYIPANVSKINYDQYIPKYEQYLDVDKYIRFAKYMEHARAPASAEKCNTTAQLHAWRKRAEAPMKAFIPKEFRSFSTSPIERKYEQNLKRIQAAQNSQDGPKGTQASGDSVFLMANIGDYDRKGGVDHERPFSGGPSSNSAIPDFGKFVPDFKQYIPDYKQYIPTNVSQFDYQKFIPDYEKYQDVKKYQDFANKVAEEKAPPSAKKCTSMKELDAWRKGAEAPARAFIPKMWRSFTQDSIEEEYARNKKRIEAAEEAKKDQSVNATAAAPSARRLGDATKSDASAAAQHYEQFIPNYAKYQDVQKYMRFAKFMQNAKAPSSAADCKTKEELDAWKAVREAPIKAFVPKRWQHLESVQEEYERNLKRIQKSNDLADQTGTESGATAVPMELQSEGVFASSTAQLTPSPIQTRADQDLIPAYATYMDVEMFLSFASFVQEQHAPETAVECKTMRQLNAWHRKQNAIIKQFVPAAYEAFPAHALEKKYEENKRRIKVSQNSTDATKTPSIQMAAKTLGAVTFSAALVVMFSAALIASVSWHLRRKSTLEEHLLEPEDPCAA
jgi:hypothetical protein